ncbi:MAG: hypothetical protein GQ582_09080 [Methyloprofundus sp.]|nr:hypothetical protein [Methyloprofundus sp.]
MIKLFVKLSLTAALFIGSIEIAHSLELTDLSENNHPYTSYSEFATSVCLPCHYHGIPNGTDLQKLYPKATETDIKAIILPILKEGHMPPNALYREILYNKFLQIENSSSLKKQ